MTMKTICIVTSTRADWGIQRPIAEKIKEDDSYNLLIFVTGTHYCQAFGNTYEEILKDGFNIDERVDMQLYADSPAAVSKTLGLTVIGFADAFSRYKIDLLIVQGDRYEMLGVCIAAMMQKIPIAHVGGGEVTLGAIDDAIRHSISKLSYLHFAGSDEGRKRIIQLGEEPQRVFAVGEMGIDNIREFNLLNPEEISKSINFEIQHEEYGVIAFYPETLCSDSIETQCNEILSAIDDFPEMKFIFTKSNADEGGALINKIFEEYAQNNKKMFVTPSLGNIRYLSVLKHAAFMLGNSSSGIVEAPYFNIPTINLGMRQKGRLQAKSIINSPVNRESICQAINTALSAEFKSSIINQSCPYGDGHAAERTLKIIHEWLDNDKIDLKKQFYDIEVMK